VRLLFLLLLLVGCSEDRPAFRRHNVGFTPGEPGVVAGQFDGFYSNGESWLRLEGGHDAALIRIGDGDFRFKVNGRAIRKGEGYVVGQLIGTSAPDSTTTTATFLAVYDAEHQVFHASMQFTDLANPDGDYVLMTLRKP
jgi:hypothetical protein